MEALFHKVVSQVKDWIRPHVLSGHVQCSDIDYCVGALYSIVISSGHIELAAAIQDVYTLGRIKVVGNLTFQEGIPDFTPLNDLKIENPRFDICQLYSTGLSIIDRLINGEIIPLTSSAFALLPEVFSSEAIALSISYYQAYHQVRYGGYLHDGVYYFYWPDYDADKDRDHELLDRLYRIGQVYLNPTSVQNKNGISEAIAKAFYGDKAGLIQKVSSVNPTIPKGYTPIILIPRFKDEFRYSLCLQRVLIWNNSHILILCDNQKTSILTKELEEAKSVIPVAIDYRDDSLSVLLSSKGLSKTKIINKGCIHVVNTNELDSIHIENKDYFFPEHRLERFIDDVQNKRKNNPVWRAINRYIHELCQDLKERLMFYLAGYVDAGVIDEYYHPIKATAVPYMVGLISTRLALSKLTIDESEKRIKEVFSTASCQQNLTGLIKDSRRPKVFQEFYIADWSALLGYETTDWKAKVLGPRLGEQEKSNLVSTLLRIESSHRDLFPEEVFPPLEDSGYVPNAIV